MIDYFRVDNSFPLVACMIMANTWSYLKHCYDSIDLYVLWGS